MVDSWQHAAGWHYVVPRGGILRLCVGLGGNGVGVVSLALGRGGNCKCVLRGYWREEVTVSVF